MIWIKARPAVEFGAQQFSCPVCMKLRARGCGNIEYYRLAAMGRKYKANIVCF
jgi:hypothetical protein